MQRSQAASFLRLLSVHAWGYFEINVDPISHELNNWDLYSAGPWGCVPGMMAQSLHTLPKFISVMSRCHGEWCRCDKRGFVYIRWECGQVGPDFPKPQNRFTFSWRFYPKQLTNVVIHLKNRFVYDGFYINCAVLCEDFTSKFSREAELK